MNTRYPRKEFKNCDKFFLSFKSLWVTFFVCYYAFRNEFRRKTLHKIEFFSGLRVPICKSMIMIYKRLRRRRPWRCRLERILLISIVRQKSSKIRFWQHLKIHTTSIFILATAQSYILPIITYWMLRFAPKNIRKKNKTHNKLRRLVPWIAAAAA